MKLFHKVDVVFIGIFSVVGYIGYSLLFSMGKLMGERKFTLDLLLYVCLHNPYCLISILTSPLIGLLLWYVFQDHHTVNVSRKKAGNGQYGYARFMTPQEKNKTYPFVKRGKESKPGFVVEYTKAGWRVDTSDQSMLMISPPGGGKTTSEYEPTIRYNAEVCKRYMAHAASMIITDVKGKLLSDMGDDVRQAGYAVYSLNFRYPLFSYQYNLMNNVNTHMDLCKSAENKEDGILEQAKAEKFAKLLASSIVKNTGASAMSNSESSEYFNQTSEGLMTAMILLVSEYGRGVERHIVSVFRLIIELNGLSEGSAEALQKNRLEQLFEVLPENHRAKLFAGASTKADVRTSMNIFSSALGKLVSFIDAELEQMICEHSTELNAEDFIQRPTAIFLIMPDEDPTKHFFASLFIRNMMNELIAIAERQQGEHVLPRPVINLWDEFGQIPPVKDFATLTTAARSRGIRFLTALQSLGQLEDKYAKAQAKIIRQAFQMTFFSYQSPNALETAQEFSKVLGNYTTLGGSVSRGDRNNSHSVQLMGRALMTEEEIITMPLGQWVLIKSGHHPVKTKLLDYQSVFKAKSEQIEEALPVNQQRHVKEISYLTEEKIRMRAQAAYTVRQGMFDIGY